MLQAMDTIICAVLLLVAIGGFNSHPEPARLYFLGKLWDGVKKVGGFIGDVASKAAPALTFIPGIGPVAAAGIGAAGKALGGLNDGGVGDLANAAIMTRAGLQSERDQMAARDRADAATMAAQANMDRANALYEQTAPMRGQFIEGAMNFYDPTNPFSAPMAAAAPAAPTVGGPANFRSALPDDVNQRINEHSGFQQMLGRLTNGENWETSRPVLSRGGLLGAVQGKMDQAPDPREIVGDRGLFGAVAQKAAPDISKDVA